MAGIDDVRDSVVEANKILAELGLADGPTIERGHTSFRLPDDPDHFVIKGLGPALSLLKGDELMVCDMNGFKVSGPKELNVPNEVKMHSCIMREHPEVNSVVHVHPRFTVLMSVLQLDLGPMCLEGMQLVAKPLPMFPSPRLIIREEDGARVAELIGDSPAILLQGHGAATVGADMEDAVMGMLHLEEQAKMNWYAYCAAGPDHARIPEEMIAAERNKPRFDELPHMKGLVEQAGVVHARGAWQYWASQVSGD